MLKKPLDPCGSCRFWSVTHSLHRKPHFITHVGEGFCNPEGTPHLGVAFVAEASGESEEADGLPLRPYAQAGSMHVRTLRSMYVSPSQVYATNILACRPPNNKLVGPSDNDKAVMQSVIASCFPLRDARLRNFRYLVSTNPNVKQSVIVALGDVAFQTLTNQAGERKSISYQRGYPFDTAAYGTVIGTFHPAYVRRNTKLMGVLQADYKKAFRIAREGLNPLPRTHWLNPNSSQMRDFKERVLALDPNDPMATLIFDFETPEEHEPGAPTWQRPIVSAQFSLQPGTGIFVGLTRDTKEWLREVLASPCRKAGHNVWDFDVPLANWNEMPISGIIDDTMWMFHHYQPDLTIEEAGAEAGADLRFSTAAGLQYVASFYGADTVWKHKRTDTDPEVQKEYGVEDVDNNARILYGCNGYESLPSQMMAKGVWNGYERYVRDFYPILLKMADRGIPINRERQFALIDELHVQEVIIDAKIQKIHPDELKRLDPKEGFKNGPKEGPKVRQVEGGWEWYDDDSEVPVDEKEEMEAEGDAAVVGVWRPMVERTFHEDKIKRRQNCVCVHDPKGCEAGHKECARGKGLSAFNGFRPCKDCASCGGKGMVTTFDSGDVVRWARLIPFRPSNKQLVKYIEHRGHKVPYDRKAKKSTTAAKGIQELVKKTSDPLYQSILDIRTLQKVSSTYLTGRGWIEREWLTKTRKHKITGMDEDYYVPGPIKPIEKQPARIHTTPTLGPATGQTSTRRPNIQNVPKHIRNENLRHLALPKKFRTLIEARPGHRIWDFDLKSAHALTLGLEARDKQYMRLARMDVHSYFTSILATKRGLWPRPIDLNLSDADLKLALKEVRSYVHPSGVNFEADIRDTKAKPTILGIGFGMQGYKLWETNKDSFANEFEAQETIKTFFDPAVGFPLLEQYQDDVVAEAHNNPNFLVSRGGFIRWFFHVYDFIYDPMVPGKFRQRHGNDAEDAKAFRPANTAFVYMRDAELRLEEMGINEYANFINVVHDSNMFEQLDDRPVVFYDPLALIDLPQGWGFQAMNPKRSPFTALMNGSSKAEDVAKLIKTEMERPQLKLADPIVAPEGLWIGCDVKAGKTWGQMEDIKL